MFWRFPNFGKALGICRFSFQLSNKLYAINKQPLEEILTDISLAAYQLARVEEVICFLVRFIIVGKSLKETSEKIFYSGRTTLIPIWLGCFCMYLKSVIGSSTTFLCICEALSRCNVPSLCHEAMPIWLVSSPGFLVSITMISPFFICFFRRACLARLCFGM